MDTGAATLIGPTAIFLIGCLTGVLLAGRRRSPTCDPETNKITDLETLNRELEKNARALAAKDLELTLANDRLGKLEAAKSKFVAVTAHQLRTPLAAIKWTFEAFLGGTAGAVSDEQRDYLEKGYVATKRTLDIVNDLLHVDLIDTKQDEFNFTTVPIEAMLERVIREFAAHVASRKLAIDFVRPPRTLPPVWGDPAKLYLVFENLIDNAVKYTRQGGRVTVECTDEHLNSAQPGIEVIVRDTGIGIDEVEQHKIFHKFYRAPNAITQEPNGSGIGLYIAKDIIDKHRGAIWFESTPGVGTAFHVRLPLSPKR